MNFHIKSSQNISFEFLQRNIFDFESAANFICNLKYGRTQNKKDLQTLFDDNCGTCSTKHAVLKQLAIENNFNDVKLVLEIVKMNAVNTPKISTILSEYNLPYIPEAHNYLKLEERILDFTRPNFTLINNTDNILEEIEIQPNQITDYKVAYHKKYLKKWLIENTEINYSLDKIWDIREQCIKALQIQQL